MQQLELHWINKWLGENQVKRENEVRIYNITCTPLWNSLTFISTSASTQTCSGFLPLVYLLLCIWTLMLFQQYLCYAIMFSYPNHAPGFTVFNHVPGYITSTSPLLAHNSNLSSLRWRSFLSHRPWAVYGSNLWTPYPVGHAPSTKWSIFLQIFLKECQLSF